MSIIYKWSASLIEDMKDQTSLEIMGDGWYLAGTLLLIPVAVIDTILIPVYLVVWALSKAFHGNIKALYRSKGGDDLSGHE